MALNIPRQANLPNPNDAQAGASSVITKIKELFVSPLTVTIISLAFILGYFGDWWTVAIAAFIGGAMFAKSSGEAFAKGTAAISTLWLLATWYHHFTTQGILSNKIAQILPVGGNVGILITTTVFIGGLVGGWGAMSGFLVRNLFRK
ncbi:hypothetical protein VB796_10265 [Arcicella sp. LKC2W]|uniref:hypothetical protein n=1 Tax=Arcicella sp. LKC2W TaxID=2984198 RepID=UPI002B2106E5|nr:hypothetical protein [Arcicella sp. LKC2W]MEA5459425.1 hypothetical protein [Arcicella sp. LKC2W]